LRKNTVSSSLKVKAALISALIIIAGWIPATAEPETPQDSLLFGEITIYSERDIAEVLVPIQRDYARQSVNTKNYESLVNRILRIPLRQGFYFPVLQLINITPDPSTLNPVLQLDWGEPVAIDTILFQGVKKTKSSVLYRMTHEYYGQRLTPSLSNRIYRSLNRFPFIAVERQNEIVTTRTGKTALLYEAREFNDNEFDGIAGYVPETISQNGYFTGEINLKFNNLSGTGRQLSVYWSKMNRYSQQIRLNYLEPWIWKSNLFGEVGFEQILRDTLVVIRNFELGTGFYSWRRGSIQITGSHEAAIPTPGGREILGLVNTSINAVGIKYGVDRLDNIYNPARGFSFQAKGNFGFQKSGGSTAALRTAIILDADFYYPLIKQLVVANSTHFKGKWFKNGEPSYADQYWFGGATSLRGYPNDFFCGSRIAWTSLELRRIIGELSSFFVFCDLGYYHESISGKSNDHLPHSYGIGVRLASRMGIIGLEYGFGKGDTFSTAKIHVRLINRF
jgi:outer membrane protein insertion porin family